MNDLTIRIRTRDDLTQLLKQGGSGWWDIGSYQVKFIIGMVVWSLVIGH